MLVEPFLLLCLPNMAGVVIIAKLEIMPVSEVDAQTLKFTSSNRQESWLVDLEHVVLECVHGEHYYHHP